MGTPNLLLAPGAIEPRYRPDTMLNLVWASSYISNA